jgi:hypothetical protein
VCVRACVQCSRLSAAQWRPSPPTHTHTWLIDLMGLPLFCVDGVTLGSVLSM